MAQYLPDLPLIEIFRHLDLVDLARARAVSRRWRALIDCCVRIDGLIVCPDAISTPENWFHIGKVGRDSRLRLDVNCNGFKKFSRAIIGLPPLDALRRFKVIESREHPETTEGYELNKLFRRLARFPSLEHLEIELRLDHFGDDNRYCSLVHQNLKVLSLGNFEEFAAMKIEIDLPRLEILRCDWMCEYVTITHPEPIKQLYNYSFTDWDGPVRVSSSDLEAFKNLELYVCNSYWVLEEVNIWSMPKLTELRVEHNDWSEQGGHLEDVRNLVTGYLAMKNRLDFERGKVKIYLNDVDIECSADLKESHPFLFPADVPMEN